MPAAISQPAMSRHPDLLGHLLHRITTLIIIAVMAYWSVSVGNEAYSAETARRPNVVLILTDDQGYGDFGFHGNPIIHTPRLDRLASESAELTNFCVSPVCTPSK